MCEGKFPQCVKIPFILKHNSPLVSINNPKCFLSNVTFLVFQEAGVFLASHELSNIGFPNNCQNRSVNEITLDHTLTPKGCWFFWSTREAFCMLRALCCGLLEEFYISFWWMLIFKPHNDEDAGRWVSGKPHSGDGRGDMGAVMFGYDTCTQCTFLLLLRWHHIITYLMGLGEQQLKRCPLSGNSGQAELYLGLYWDQCCWERWVHSCHGGRGHHEGTNF